VVSRPASRVSDGDKSMALTSLDELGPNPPIFDPCDTSFFISQNPEVPLLAGSSLGFFEVDATVDKAAGTTSTELLEVDELDEPMEITSRGLFCCEEVAKAGF
jgi:hypothetical protein